jgi:hypothetical protein
LRDILEKSVMEGEKSPVKTMPFYPYLLKRESQLKMILLVTFSHLIKEKINMKQELGCVYPQFANGFGQK